ncbi:MAG: DUF4838 domain-containing protein [Kiritimatiellia bacterium]
MTTLGKTILTSCLAAASWASALQERTQPDEFVFADQGRAKAAIVCPQNAPQGVRYAATELADFLGQMTGARFAIVDQPVDGLNTIRIGAPHRPQRPEELYFKVKSPSEMHITGDGARGTLYAVYDLLEQFGCGFFFHDYDYVPLHTNTLALAVGTERRDAPFMRLRSMWSQIGRHDFAWNMKLRTHDGPKEQWQQQGFGIPPNGNMAIQQTLCTFYLNRAKYFKEHPEYYAYVAARKEHSPHFVCVHQEPIYGIICKEIEEYIAQHPEETKISLGLDDGAERCECEKCLKLTASLGEDTGIPTSAAQYIYFMNKIARLLGKKYPKVTFSMLAYDNMRRAPIDPAKCPLEPNVRPAIALLWKNHCRPTYCCEGAERAVADWSKASQLGIYNWDYYANFASYLIPFPNYDILGKNFRYYADLNHRGFYSQMSFTFDGDLAELHYWLYAKLCWNPYADDSRLIDTYLKGAYGPCAQLIARYIERMLHARDRQRASYHGCYLLETDNFINPSDVFEIWQIAERCTQIAKQNGGKRMVPTLRATIGMRLLSVIRYGDLSAEAAKRRVQIPSRRELYDRFVHATSTGENDKGSDWCEFLGTRERFRTIGTNLVAQATRPAEKPSFSVTPEMMSGGRRHAIQKDASGSFVRLNTDYSNKDLYQIYMNPDEAEVGYNLRDGEFGQWYVLARVRAKTNAEADPAVAYLGFYERYQQDNFLPTRRGNAESGYLQQPAEMPIEGRAGDEAFHTYCLGKFNFKPTARLWLMSGVLSKLEFIDVAHFIFLNPSEVDESIPLRPVDGTKGNFSIQRDAIDDFRYAHLDCPDQADCVMEGAFDTREFGKHTFLAKVRINTAKPLDLNAARLELFRRAGDGSEALLSTTRITGSKDEKAWQTIVVEGTTITPDLRWRIRPDARGKTQAIDLKNFYFPAYLNR